MRRITGLFGNLEWMVALIDQAGNEAAAGGTPNHRFGDSSLVADFRRSWQTKLDKRFTRSYILSSVLCFLVNTGKI